VINPNPREAAAVHISIFFKLIDNQPITYEMALKNNLFNTNIISIFMLIYLVNDMAEDIY